MLDLRPVAPSLLSTIIRAILDKPRFAATGARLRVFSATADCHRGLGATQVVWVIELRWWVGGKAPKLTSGVLSIKRAHQEMEDIINGENVIYYVIFGRSELGLNQIQFASM